MNKRERVLNAMNCKPVDHVPVGLWFHFKGEEAKGENCIQAHLRLECAHSSFGIVPEITVDAIRPQIIAQARQCLLQFGNVGTFGAIAQDPGAESDFGIRMACAFLRRVAAV